MKEFMKILHWLFLFTILFVSFGFSQDPDRTIIHINKIPVEGILLNKGWKFQIGDNPEYAKPGYDDNAWASINPALNVHDSLPQIPKSGICWFRIHVIVDSNINSQLALMIYQSGASEFYLNGNMINHFGLLGTDPGMVRAYDPFGKPLLFHSNTGIVQVLAIRYALQPGISYTIFSTGGNPALMIRVNTVEASMEKYYHHYADGLSVLEYFRTGVFFILVILHLAFYLFYPPQKANLYFFLFALIIGASQIIGVRMIVHEVQYKFYYYNLAQDLNLLSYLFLITALYILLSKKRGWIFWTAAIIIAAGILLNACTYSLGLLISGVIAPNLIGLEIARIAFTSVKADKGGGWIILGGAIGFLLFTLAYIVAFFFGFYDVIIFANFQFVNLAFNFATLSIPVATSIYLGLDFAFTNRALKQKLREVEDLSQKAIAQEQEKQLILAKQNETLEKQVNDRTAALSHSLKELNETQAQLIQSEKMASLGELTAGIAHEIQNPLNFVNNFSEVNKELLIEMKDEIKKGNIDEVSTIADDVISNEEKINHHGKRADAIVKGMLQHSRSSTGVKELADINKLADEYLRLSYHGLRAKDKEFNAELKTDFDNSIGKINIIPQDIGRVLLNLYNNAFYAVNEKIKTVNENYHPTVSVQTKKIYDKIILTVMDNGSGIPQKVVDKIFQPFFTTKPTGQGTGLGLSLSYDIIKAHGGEIKVDTKENEGTEFIIELPAV
jgi:two-component system, NtrC family, sensor kinase